MSRLVRADQFEIGLEREYALYAWADGAVAYLLANDRLLAILRTHIAADAERRERWHAMEAAGWRIAAEYSRCLVEIASPPHTRDAWLDLLEGFALLEDWLARAADQLAAQSRFERIECTAAYSVRTDRFLSWDGASVTTYRELLLDGAHANWLLGSPAAIPACLAESAPALLYAGFTSTHATVHPPMRADRDLAAYFWQLLHTARQLETRAPQRHALLRAGRHPVAPDPDLSIRDALIRWGDPRTAALLDTLSPGAGLAQFVALFGQPPSAAFTATDFHAYSCRPRVVERTLLFELRCFHSGLPLVELAALLDVFAMSEHRDQDARSDDGEDEPGCDLEPGLLRPHVKRDGL